MMNHGDDFDKLCQNHHQSFWNHVYQNMFRFKASSTILILHSELGSSGDSRRWRGQRANTMFAYTRCDLLILPRAYRDSLSHWFSTYLPQSPTAVNPAVHKFAKITLRTLYATVRNPNSIPMFWQRESNKFHGSNLETTYLGLGIPWLIPATPLQSRAHFPCETETLHWDTAPEEELES